MAKRNHRPVFGGGATYNSLGARVYSKLINRIFDKKSNSNTLHDYKNECHKMSQCCGLLRYFVEKVSHLGVNVPHNDMTFYDVITRKASRAECGAACQNDRLSAGLVGRLGGTFNARRREQIMKELEQSDVVIPNTGTTLTPTLSLYKRRGSKVKEILNQVQNDY